MASLQPSVRSARHYGLDWLRIGAFALLIVHHVAMVFAPWHWVVKWPETYPALIAPMALLTPWRLPLLFVVSGFATSSLLLNTPALADFVRQRSARLLIPVAFALVALLPVEMWVRERIAGYPGTLIAYWLGDYWSLTPINGYAFPSWEHLWFVVYLWAYTIVLVAILARFGGEAAGRMFDRLAVRRTLVWAPIVALASVKLVLQFLVAERQGLTTDWAGHALYFPLFLFGFALARSDQLWPAIARTRGVALLLAVVSGAACVAIELAYQGDAVPSHVIMAVSRVARIVMAWAMILVLLDVANRWLNRDHPIRATLAAGVFPAYIIHHPVIVVLAWNAPALGLGPVAGFVTLVCGTAAACLAFYAIGRDIGWARPLIGLAPVKRRSPAVAALEPAP